MHLVIAALTVSLGPPTNDSGWIDQQSPCDQMGVHTRDVTWGWLTIGLSDDFPATHDHHLVAQVTHHSQVVGNEHQRQLILIHQVVRSISWLLKTYCICLLPPR